MGILIPKKSVSESVDHHPAVFSLTLPSSPPLYNHLKKGRTRGELFPHNQETLNGLTHLFLHYPSRSSRTDRSRAIGFVSVDFSGRSLSGFGILSTKNPVKVAPALSSVRHRH